MKDPLTKITHIYQFYIEKVSAYTYYKESFFEGLNYYKEIETVEYGKGESDNERKL